MVIRRSKRIRALAATHGWLWRKHDESVVGAFIGYPFGIGRGERADDVMRGPFQGRQVLLFDLGFRTGSGDDERTWWIGVYCVTDLPRALPVLEVVRRGWTRPGPSRGIGSRYQTGDRDFDRHYRVTTQSQASAAAVLSPAFISYLQAGPAFDWRIEGTRMLTWGPGPMRPKRVEGMLSQLVALASAIPQEAWRR